MKIPAASVAAIVEEFQGVALGDSRRDERVHVVVERLSTTPGESFPRAIGDDSDLESAYRLVSNERVMFDALLDPHHGKTAKRVAVATRAIVAHDTSEFDYSGTPVRAGLGRLRGNGGRNDQGFFAHCALAVAADGSRRALGLLGVDVFMRTGPKKSRTKKGRRVSGAEYAKRPEKESNRWAKLVDQCEARMDEQGELIHVMDREADAFPLLLHLVQTKRHFVVRLTRDRVVEAADDAAAESKLRAALETATDHLEVEVPISKRGGKAAPRHAKALPARKARCVKLRYSAMTLRLRSPRYHKEVDSLEVNIVWAREINCPAGETPVDWMLATTEPTGTTADVQAIVDYYRARWVIEEFFKALKTGCAVEERQFETSHALLNVFALFVPVAVQLLALRSLASSSPDAPARDVLSPTQISLLRHLSRRPLDKRRPTVKQALYAVAGVGGHLKRNGPPGWQTLGRGLEKLIACEAGYRLGLEQGRRSRARSREPDL